MAKVQLEDKPLNREDAVQATYDGGVAFRAGETPGACPYTPEDNIYSDFMAHHWLKGYSIASQAHTAAQ